MKDRRFQRSVLISAGGHCLVILLVLLTAGTRPPPKPTDRAEAILTFVPEKLVDQPVVNKAGGEDRASPAPPQQEKNNEAERQRQPTVSTERRGPTVAPKPSAQKQEPKRSSAQKPSEPRPLSNRIKVSLKPVVRSQGDHRAERSAVPNEAIEQVLGALEQRLAEASMNVSVPGAGSVSYADYALYVKMVYERAWRPPKTVSSDSATVRAEVVIRRDGQVLSARIVEGSGDPRVDQSVREVLMRIKNIGRPFPEGAKEDERRFIIRFSVRAAGGWG